MERMLSALSASLASARSVDQLIMPVLEMLNAITGLESSYLTHIDEQLGVQRIRYARNTGVLQVLPGAELRWDDTLCKRSLEAGVPLCSDVPAVWGDSRAARELGIRTYISSPVRSGDGKLLGTLCAASVHQQFLPENAVPLFGLFAGIVANFIERERLVAQLQEANDLLTSYALSDVLTGLPNRRAMLDELTHLFAVSKRNGNSVLLGVVDLDDFKTINDSLGHQAGDEFLKAVAQRLQQSIRATDRVGRIGGDEFLFLGMGPVNEAHHLPDAVVRDGAPAELADQLQQRLARATAGEYTLAGRPFTYAGASAGVVALFPQLIAPDDAIMLADEAMYAVKRARRQG